MLKENYAKDKLKLIPKAEKQNYRIFYTIWDFHGKEGAVSFDWHE